MTEPDRILIRALEVPCVIGAFAKERHAPQLVSLDLDLEVDARRAAASDDLADAVDYKELKDRVVAAVGASSHQLLETLAEQVAALCLEDPGVLRVRVVVDKPGALTGARSVAVAVTRGR